MAASKLKDGAHKLFGSHSHDALSKTESNDPQLKEKEKQFIANYLERRDTHVEEPKPDGTAPSLKVGCSVQQLAVKDFKLIKTLGTGLIKAF